MWTKAEVMENLAQEVLQTTRTVKEVEPYVLPGFESGLVSTGERIKRVSKWAVPIGFIVVTLYVLFRK
jgi:hypothetical protein